MKFENIENFKKLTKEASGKIVGGLPGGDDSTKTQPLPRPTDTTGTGPVYKSTYCKVNGLNLWDKFD